MPTTRPRCQAWQASLSQEPPQPPDGGVRQIIEIQLKRVSHPHTHPDRPMAVQRISPQDKITVQLTCN